MIRIFELAAEVQAFCDSKGWKSCLIGGIATQYWGESRVTRDVDVQLLTGFGNETIYLDILLEKFEGRIPDAREFALRNRVALVKSSDGVGIDISLAGLPYEEQAVDRAVTVDFLNGSPLRICSAEDLMVMKLFAGRAIDLRDVESVAIRFGRKVDWEYVETNLLPLLEAKEDYSALSLFKRLKEQFAC